MVGGHEPHLHELGADCSRPKFVHKLKIVEDDDNDDEVYVEQLIFLQCI